MTLKQYECPKCGRDGDRFSTTPRIARSLAEDRDACVDAEPSADDRRDPSRDGGASPRRESTMSARVYFHEPPRKP